MAFKSEDFAGNIDRFTGFAETYDKYRPVPPAILLDILTQMAEMNRPNLVVDLGCGTGTSTRVWADRAEKTIGIDPTPDMLRQAKEHQPIENVSYQLGFSHQTGLPDQCADVVSCSQSLHWMEPSATFQEVARILRPGGVFAAIDYDWPPTLSSWRAEQAFLEVWEQIGEIRNKHELPTRIRRWSKTEHLERMRISGRFRYTKELVVHHVLQGNAERLMGFARSLEGVEDLLKLNLLEINQSLERLEQEARLTLGDELRPWYIGYRVRIGIR